MGIPGSGKTTILKLITGLVRPTAGSIRMFGNPVHDRATRRRIGFLPETPYFYEHLTGYEFLRLHGHLTGMDNDRARVYEILNDLGLKEMDDIPLGQYPREILQLIGIAQAMISDPDLLLLDEPLRFLNPLQRERIVDLMLNMKKKGKTIVLSSAVLPDITRMCDRVGALQRGHLVHIDKVSHLLKKRSTAGDTGLREWIDAVKGR